MKKVKLNINTLLAAVFLLQSVFLKAQSNNDSLYFQAITMKNGLPGSIIMDFEQDSLGFMWIATNDGLCRYDGTKFTIFRYHPNSENSLWNNYVQNLFIDKNENLWIMTSNGLNKFDLKKNAMERIYAQTEGGGLLDYSPIDMVETIDGTLFIGSYYSGINCINTTTGKYTYLTTNNPGKDALSSDWVNCMEVYNDSLVFIGYRNAGIDIYNPAKGTITWLGNIMGDNLPSYHINSMCIDNNHGLWIGTDAGLAYYNIKSGKSINFGFKNNDNSFVADREILSLYTDTKDNLWIGTRRNGLVVVNQSDVLLNGKRAKFAQYLPDNSEGSLSYRTILKIFNDAGGQVWIGTDGGGFDIVESRYKRFERVFHINNKTNSLSYNKVWGITEDKYGNFWIGTDGDGINVWNKNKGVVKNFRHNHNQANSISDNAIISALTDSKGRIWLGTYEGGINRYIEETESFKHYKAPNNLPVNDVRCIYEDHNKVIWVGMNRGGIARYNEKTDTFEAIAATMDYDIRAIYALNGDLWLGTYSFGLLKYNMVSDVITPFDQIVKNETKVGIQTVFSIYGDNSDVIWFGTDNLGLGRLNIKTGDLKTYLEEDGLANNKVHAILPDPYGNLWLSTNSGISRFNTNDEVFYNYDWHKGVQAQEFHNGSKLITTQGLLCFGGIDGMNYFNPKYFQETSHKPNLQFTGFTVLNRPIVPGTDNIIDKSIEYQPNVKLNHEHSFFEIAYQSLNFPFSKNNTYEYMLEGYDKEWINAGSQNIASYKNVPAGDYVFKVKSYEPSAKSYFDEISLKISIAPPIWKTVWAYIFYIATIGIITLIVFRSRVRQIKYKSQIAYEQKLREKQEKIHEERLEFFTNISHELRTPLTIISAALEEMEAIKNMQPKLKRIYETAIKNSDRLKDLINKLLEFRRVERGMANLSVSKLGLNKYLQGFLQDFRQLAKSNNINLKLSLPLDELSLWIDQDKFAMILNNLLSNAIKNTEKGGQIVLGADEDDDHIIVQVKDTGIGIEKANLKKIFNRYYKVENKSTDTGIGLALTKKLVELHHGNIEVESVPDKGTNFTLKFLKGKSHYSSNQLLVSSEEEEMLDPIETKENWLNDESVMLTGEQQVLLFIDDNKEILDLLHDKFVEKYKIIRAQSGEEGVQLARKYSPDLIISDIMMPGISGIEVCQQLKSDTATSHIPIILLTAKGSEKDEIEGLNTGADDYISKPFKFTILRARVNTILENRKKISNYFGTYEHIPEAVEEVNALPDKELAFLNKLNDYVLNKCLSENVSVFDMAADLGFSRTSLYRKVKSLTGLSINAFVRSVKIKKSAEFITEGMNVSEAAYSVGFEDLKYFRECFKKQVGKNPSDFK